VRNDIALAIPFFLLAMAGELLWAWRRGRKVYRLADAVADLGCGVGQQVAMVFLAGWLLAVYGWMAERAALVRFPAGSLWPWILAFLWVDVAYYWWHRLSHEVNLLWAVHAVHHQSEDYNLAVALRQAVLSVVTSFPFYAPMALWGVPTAVYVAAVSFSTLYQFWIHTELVGKLGPVEGVLNTPSAHRVHHAVNPGYLDRNYGAVLIVWDRLFGSYAEERERPVYGVTHPLRSFNPAWAQLQPWAEVAAKARRLRGLDKLRIWWRSPSWSPGGEPLPGEAEVQARPRHEPVVSRGRRLYALLQFAPLVALTFLMLLGQSSADPRLLAAGGLFTLWTLAAVGGLLDGRRWALPVEALRLAAVAVALAVLALGASGLGGL